MKISINGEPVDVPEALTVSQLLVAHKVKMPDMVTVELNGEILDRGAFDTTAIRENDKVELLYFMGGGGKQVVGVATSLRKWPLGRKAADVGWWGSGETKVKIKVKTKGSEPPPNLCHKGKGVLT